MGTNLCGVVVEGVEGPPQCRVGEAAGAVDALAETHDLHPADDVGEPVTIDVGHEQADRVGPAVDRGHPGHHGTRVGSWGLPVGW